MLPDFDFCSDIFEKNGLNLTDDLYNKLDTYAKFLVEYNINVNLTAITAPEEILINLRKVAIIKTSEPRNLKYQGGDIREQYHSLSLEEASY